MVATYNKLSELYSNKQITYRANTDYATFLNSLNPVSQACLKGIHSTNYARIDAFYPTYVWLAHNCGAYCSQLEYVMKASPKLVADYLKNMPNCVIDIIADTGIFCSATVHNGIMSLMLNEDGYRSGAIVQLYPFTVLNVETCNGNTMCSECGQCIEGLVPNSSYECFGTIETSFGTVTKLELICKIVNAFHNPHRYPVIDSKGLNGKKGTKQKRASTNKPSKSCGPIFVRAHMCYPKKGEPYLRRAHYRGFPDKIKRKSF